MEIIRIISPYPKEVARTNILLMHLTLPTYHHNTPYSLFERLAQKHTFPSTAPPQS